MTTAHLGPAAEPKLLSYASQGLKLSFTDWGNPDAPLLVLIHGNRDHARSWDQVAEALRAEWHVVAPDLRGHGHSDWSPDGAYLSSYNLLDIVNLLQFLEADRAAVVGHSFGGNLAARVAGAFPEYVGRLALVDGFGPPPDAFAHWARTGPVLRTREWIEQRRAVTSRPHKIFARVEDAAQRLLAGNPLMPAARALELASHGLRRSETGFQWRHDPLVAPFAPEDFLADNAAETWQAIACPTLLCFGAESWNKNPELDGRAQRLADYRIAAIAGAGHWPQHDQPDAFIAVLRQFLRETTAL